MWPYSLDCFTKKASNFCQIIAFMRHKMITDCVFDWNHSNLPSNSFDKVFFGNRQIYFCPTFFSKCTYYKNYICAYCKFRDFLIEVEKINRDRTCALSCWKVKFTVRGWHKIHTQSQSCKPFKPFYSYCSFRNSSECHLNRGRSPLWVTDQLVRIYLLLY